MSFDLASEEFSIIHFPEKSMGDELIKFNGKLAVVPNSVSYGEFDMWILLNDNMTWKKHHFAIHELGYRMRDDLVGLYHCKGTVSTGELVFAPERLVHGAVELFYYNMKGENLSKDLIEVASEDDDSEDGGNLFKVIIDIGSEDNDYLVETFLEYIPEPLLLTVFRYLQYTPLEMLIY